MGAARGRASSPRPASSSSTPTSAPGGAWQHRWPSLTVGTTHRVHDLPGLAFEPETDSLRAAEVVPAYFAEYERRFRLPVHRPVRVRAVSPHRRRPVPRADRRRRLDGAGDRQRDRHLDPSVRAPLPRPGDSSAAASCTPSTTAPPTSSPGSTSSWSAAGPRRRSCSARSRGSPTPPGSPAGRRSGATGPFDEDAGRRAVALVEEAVREGRRPGSVVGVTGLLVSTPYIRDALDRGVLDRLPMFDRITPDGVAWDDGTVVARRRHPLGHRLPRGRRRTWRRCTCASPAAASGWTAPTSPGNPGSTSSATAPRPARSAPTAPASPPPGSCAGCCARPELARSRLSAGLRRTRGPPARSAGRSEPFGLLDVVDRIVVVASSSSVHERPSAIAPPHLLHRLPDRRQRRVGDPGHAASRRSRRRRRRRGSTARPPAAPASRRPPSGRWPRTPRRGRAPASSRAAASPAARWPR